MHICVVGTGYVGLVTGACLADFGMDVTCVDKDKSKIDMLLTGMMPIYEPGLDTIVAKNARVILVTCHEVARDLEGTYLTAVTELGDAWQIANSVTGCDASVLFVEKARRLIPEGWVSLSLAARTSLRSPPDRSPPVVPGIGSTQESDLLSPPLSP